MTNMMRYQWVGFKTILIKEVTRIFRIWAQTLLPPMITMTLYFIIFGNLIGRRIGEMGGYSYIQYIAPGLVMMTVIMNSYSNVTSAVFGARFSKSIEEMLVSPMANSIILIGYVAAGMIRGLSAGLLVTIIALFFTRLSVHHLFFMLAVAVLSSALFSLAGFTNALYANKFDDVTIIPTFILTPLTYLGGVFYSIDLLPSFWQKLSHANPILYMVNGFRYGVLGVSDIRIGLALAVIAGFTVLLFIFNLMLLNRGKGIRT